MYNEQSSIQNTSEEMSSLPGRGSVLGLKGGYGGMSKKHMNNFDNLCERLVHKKIKERVIRKKPLVSMYGNIMLKPEIQDQDNKSFLEQELKLREKFLTINPQLRGFKPYAPWVPFPQPYKEVQFAKAKQ